VEFGFHNATSIGIWTPNGGYLEFPIASVGYNQWHQVAAVADGNGYALYLDGVLQATGGNAITTGSYGSSASPFRIGGGGILDASANTINGAIDEVAVFNYALSAGQVQNLYQAVPNVVLKIQPVGTQLQLSWPQGTLLEANDLTGPWTTNSATSPCLVPTSAAKKFYRVIVK
ncbi:MAG TPA: LamG domain-containing protein, partial [Candidatus Sulfotelmatobacter sp.]|nr:LamG domain-containing protein [Candidatus Sulfotelmatobacter sp.]